MDRVMRLDDFDMAWMNRHDLMLAMLGMLVVRAVNTVAAAKIQK
jgi:hypothetical protein